MVTRLYLRPLEMGGDCHQVPVSPSSAFCAEWTLFVSFELEG